MGLVKKFEEIRKDDILDVGGKGANLGEMVSADIAVPPGFVVTFDAYRRFLKENGLNELFLRTMNEAQDDPEKLRAAAALFREKILSSTLPSEIVSEVTAAYNSLSVKCGIPPFELQFDLRQQQRIYRSPVLQGSRNIFECNRSF